MNTIRRRLFRMLIVAGGVALLAPASPVTILAQPNGQPAAVRLPVARVTVSGTGGEAAFRVEIAATPRERALGLQHRRSLADDAGMLFVFEPSQPVTMWMKDTFIPLDMLFLAADGRIAGIARDTEPHALALIRSPGPVSAVLELNAGTAARLGLEAGDHVDLTGVRQARR